MGSCPRSLCAITGFLLANWFFSPPYYEFTISEVSENLVALVIFLLVGGVVSVLVATASRRTADAARCAPPRPRRSPH